MWQYFGLFEGKIVEDVRKVHILDIVKEEVNVNQFFVQIVGYEYFISKQMSTNVLYPH